MGCRCQVPVGPSAGLLKNSEVVLDCCGYFFLGGGGRCLQIQDSCKWLTVKCQLWTGHPGLQITSPLGNTRGAR